MNGHEPLTAGLRLADGFDLRRRHLDPLIHPDPILLETKDQLAHPQGYLIAAVVRSPLSNTGMCQSMIATRYKNPRRIGM